VTLFLRRGKEGIQVKEDSRDGIFKLLRNPGYDSKESIPAANV
jgi:hypothetical protein